MTVACKITCTPPAPPSTTRPKAFSKKMAIQRMIAGFRPHEVPHMGEIGETDLKREISHMQNALYSWCVRHFGLHVEFDSSTHSFSGGVYGGIVCSAVASYSRH